MTGKRVVPRDLARRDVDAAIDFYLGEAGPEVASDFIEALQRVYRDIAVHPALGSPRYAHELALPGSRSWALKGFPYLVFYVEREDHIGVLRVLHARRDIPSRMREPGS